jgi:hypothetical protein
MQFTHVQNHIYVDEAERRFHLFLRWHDAARRTRYQRVDFGTRAEAACFLAGAMYASKISGRAIHLDVLSPDQFQRAAQKPRHQ